LWRSVFCANWEQVFYQVAKGIIHVIKAIVFVGNARTFFICLPLKRLNSLLAFTADKQMPLTITRQ
jgi:hypothetical protein